MRALIADDEPHIRNGLRKRIEWEKLGIEEVYTAEDGEEALKICGERRPEIIITDIRMPGIDGLELADQAAKQYGAKKILIMSGYSEFEYAQTAIKIGVVDYLLKPVNLDEITRLIDSSVQAIKAEEEKEDLAFSDLAQRVLKGTEPSERLLGSIIKGEDVKGEIICGTVCADDIYGSPVSNITKEMLRNSISGEHLDNPVIFPIHENCLAFILRLPDSAARKHYQGLCISILHRMNKENSLKCSMGVSSIGNFKEISRLYEQAENALSHRMYQGPLSCIFYEMVSGRQQPAGAVYYLDVKAFKEQVSYFRIEDVNQQIEKGFQRLFEENCTEKKKAQELCISVKSALIEAMHDKGIDVMGLLENNRDMFEKELLFDTLESYERWCKDICYLLLKGLQDLSAGHHSLAVEKAVDYINQHYQEDINLRSLAEMVKKSTNYFSYIFKKEMGMNFNEYLNEVRINKAKELLNTTDYMIYEISEMAGFHDYKYFTRVFKKVCDISPTDYKNSREKGNRP